MEGSLLGGDLCMCVCWGGGGEGGGSDERNTSETTRANKDTANRAALIRLAHTHCTLISPTFPRRMVSRTPRPTPPLTHLSQLCTHGVHHIVCIVANELLQRGVAAVRADGLDNSGGGGGDEGRRIAWSTRRGHIALSMRAQASTGAHRAQHEGAGKHRGNGGRTKAMLSVCMPAGSIPQP
jgi:hypothetical protein